ncbi:2-oxoglutarate and iron-dependent oxygenase domain-containing protein 3-like [Leptopilina boulardi]|uniref:2-oxoglutarate and iron-dependent oxygenase domain-containing protein 3-like n=1 Tax=Leptopilina boulardi TaxID=63433 RepID=UPI0021F5E940|nr:2-oxoglutarate and iron-dependent oxygenase domain-containing protein 3-like [Leptopilina boulardi]
MTQEHKKGKRKDAQKEKDKEKKDKEKIKSEEKPAKPEIEYVKPKYGGHLIFPYQKVWSRSIVIFAILFIVWYNSKDGKEISLALQKDILISRQQNIECSDSYKAEMNKFSGCLPEKCARIVTDKLVSATETDVLLKLAINSMNLGGSDGGASILDLHSGALSKGDGFINVYDMEEAKKIFNNADFAIYKVVKTKIQHAIAHHFGVDSDKLYLTKPTFFSRITSLPAKTIHDEYWHPHVDKVTYESFHYTSLLYLSDFNKDFKGGRFLFIDKHSANSTIEPRKGRVSMFTSGAENVHMVEKITSGTRYALTVSFTCDKEFAISDPRLPIDSKRT